MLAVVGLKSLVMVSKIGCHRGLILGPLCCRFIGGSLTVIAACSSRLSWVLFWATVSMVVLFQSIVICHIILIIIYYNYKYFVSHNMLLYIFSYESNGIIINSFYRYHFLLTCKIVWSV